MTAPQNAAAPSPLRFFESANAYQRTRAIEAAVQLDLFTAIGEAGGAPGSGAAGAAVADIARRCNAAERGVRILCDFLTVLGFLTKENFRYSLAPDAAAFLDKRSPAYMGSALQFLLSPLLTRNFDVLAAAVRKGGTAADEHGTTAPEAEVWVDFAAGMGPMQRMPAGLIARLLAERGIRTGRVLDLAAGHGMFGIGIAQANPQAEITALDWPNVLEVAKANARAAGIESRYRTIPGSGFEVEYGTGYDAVLLTNILHHFDREGCETLLRKVHAALAPGGCAVTLEFVPNEDRVTPPETATFALIMLASTPSGDAYTFSEYDAMFRNAGFARSSIHPLPPTFQQVILSFK